MAEKKPVFSDKKELADKLEGVNSAPDFFAHKVHLMTLLPEGSLKERVARSSALDLLRRKEEIIAALRG